MEIAIDKNIEKLICPKCEMQIDYNWRYLCNSTSGKYLIIMCSYCNSIISFSKIKESSRKIPEVKH